MYIFFEIHVKILHFKNNEEHSICFPNANYFKPVVMLKLQHLENTFLTINFSLNLVISQIQKRNKSLAR